MNNKIGIYIKKAREALANNNLPTTASNIINAINIRPDDQDLIDFLKELEDTLSKKDFDKLRHILQKTNKVNTMMRDRGTVEESSFTQKEVKESGRSPGYKAIEIPSRHKFMLKKFIKNPSHDENINLEREQGIRELIAGDLYQLLLYDRAPKVALVQSENPEELYVRSKYLATKSLIQFLEGGIDDFNLINGIEKIMAAIDLLGEIDYNMANLMVRPSQDRDGRMDLLKIDHGRSLIRFPKTFKEYINNILTIEHNDERARNMYRIELSQGKLLFNIHDYSNALNDMLHLLSDDRIDAIIEKRMDELKKSGFIVSESQDINFITTFFSESLKNHIKNMRTYASILAGISKQIKEIPDSIERSTFENGEWLIVLSSILNQDPGQKFVDVINRLMGFIKPMESEQQVIDYFFEIIKPGRYGTNPKNIEDFLRKNPTFNPSHCKNKNGDSILTCLLRNPRKDMHFSKTLMTIFCNADTIEDINTLDKNRKKPLLIKMIDANENTEVLNFLLERGADPNLQDIDGNTVLMYLLRWQKINPEKIATFMAYPIDVSIRNRDGKTILDLVYEHLNNGSLSADKTRVLEALLVKLQSPALVDEKDFSEEKRIKERTEPQTSDLEIQQEYTKRRPQKR